MPSRLSSSIIPGYLFTGISGVLFTLVPPTSISAFYINHNMYFVEVFGLFFALGGFTALFSTIARKLFNVSVVPTWHFEMAGLFLQVSASAIYAYSLCVRGLETGDTNILALGLFFVGISFMFTARISETYVNTRDYTLAQREKDVD